MLERTKSLTPNPSPDARERGTVRSFGTLRPNPSVRGAAQKLRKASTPSEAQLWEVPRNRHLDGKKFRRQHPVGRFVLDFYCVEERLAIEVDGSIHQTHGEADEERQHLLDSLRIRTLRIPAPLVEEDVRSAVRLIRNAFCSSDSPLSRARERGRG